MDIFCDLVISIKILYLKKLILIFLFYRRIFTLNFFIKNLIKFLTRKCWKTNDIYCETSLPILNNLNLKKFIKEIL